MVHGQHFILPPGSTPMPNKENGVALSRHPVSFAARFYISIIAVSAR
jgi:hypothetical protein